MTAFVDLLSAVSAVLLGLMAGVYFAFSAFVMRALAAAPAGGATMVAINRVILRSPFMPLFFVSTVLSAGLGLAAIPSWPDRDALALSAAGVIYAAGMFAVTAAANVPLNRRLEREPISFSAYAAAWLPWNHIRTAASALASFLSALALV